ncbi:MAG: FAD-dependent oxidoreductase, partial [Deinococcota bacterium]|nr:FAD-dependent oxidoreductase [Deinococcota bacterium]
MTPRHSDAHNNAHSDVLVLGGGIVGLATALAFSHRHPGARVTVLEKEARV